MPFAEDQHPVCDLRPRCEYELFGTSIHARTPPRDLHGLDADIGQHRIERAGDLPGPVESAAVWPHMSGITLSDCKSPMTEQPAERPMCGDGVEVGTQTGSQHVRKHVSERDLNPP